MKVSVRLILPVLAIYLASMNVAEAKFARPTEDIPVARLIRNIQAYVKDHPKDAQGHFTLARLHALAYADPKDKLSNYGTENGLPRFGPDDYVQATRWDTKPPKNDQLIHLMASVTHYQIATNLNKTNGLYWLGYAWVLEEGAKYQPKLGKLPGDSNGHTTKEYWLLRSLDAYRTAYRLTKEGDLKITGLMMANKWISDEAGEQIVELTKSDKSQNAVLERKEIAEHREAVRKNMTGITPVIVPLHGETRLAQLISPNRTVTFDLTALKTGERWPWVNPGVGLLVWDPDRCGHIRDGQQLFGSRTWQMFWRNGYEAMAALDNNHDGWLRDRELAGISLWTDRNGDAVSDPGEVAPVEKAQIAAIRVTPAGIRDGVPWSGTGIVWCDGRRTPTFDWMPEAVETATRRPMRASSIPIKGKPLPYALTLALAAAIPFAFRKRY